MRRLTLPLATVALVIWLVLAEPPKRDGDLNALWMYARVAAQESCCLYGDETDPHLLCVNGTCQWVDGCGVSDCNACPQCNPDDESNCLANNGYWDSASCTCTPSCDPDGSLEQACYSEGGEWDPSSCACDFPACNPGPPELDSYTCAGGDGCDCEWSCDIVYCESCAYNYVQYCEDGSEYARWTEDTGMECYDTGFFCGCCS